MEDRKTARMRKYGDSKTTRIMMATVPHVTSGLGQKIRPMDFCWNECKLPVLVLIYSSSLPQLFIIFHAEYVSHTGLLNVGDIILNSFAILPQVG